MLLSINQKKLVYWQLATEGMDVLNIPEEEGYTATEKTDKYDRFTTFVREFAEKLLVGESTGLDFYGENENLRLFDNGNIGPGWWERALDLGRGKISGKNVLPNFEKTTQKDVTAVLDTFMPMYRALKESYDRRPWYQWFTNHAQYTAERDAIRALRGLMMSLTEMPSAHIQAEFEKRRDKGIKSHRWRFHNDWNLAAGTGIHFLAQIKNRR